MRFGVDVVYVYGGWAGLGCCSWWFGLFSSGFRCLLVVSTVWVCCWVVGFLCGVVWWTRWLVWDFLVLCNIVLAGVADLVL